MITLKIIMFLHTVSVALTHVALHTRRQPRKRHPFGSMILLVWLRNPDLLIKKAGDTVAFEPDV